MTRHAIVLAMATILVPALADAQRAVVLAPRIEPLLSPADRTKLVEALFAALRAEGSEPVEAQTAEPCADDACGQTEREAAHADQAVQLTVWSAAEGADNSVAGVSVSVLDARGYRYSDGVAADQHPTAWSTSVAEATSRAFARLRRGPGPWLELSGTPEGASIKVDDRPAGSVPGRYRVAGGLHHVVVEHPGFAPYDQTVTVPRNIDALRTIVVQLHPGIGPNDATQQRSWRADRTSRSPWNYALGGAAAALGFTLSVGPVRTALDDGECGRIEAGRCTGVVRFDGLRAAQLGTAVLLVAGGAVLAIWGPLRVRVDSSAAMAEAPLRF